MVQAATAAPGGAEASGDERIDVNELRMQLEQLEVTQREQDTELREERRQVAMLCAQHDAAAAELRVANNKLKAREYVLTQRADAAEARRDGAVVAARNLFAVGAPRAAHTALLRWCMSMLQRHLEAGRVRRAAAASAAAARVEVYQSARTLVVSAGTRHTRRMAQVFVLHALRANVRARKAERSGVGRHFAKEALVNAEKERREAAEMHAQAVREREAAERAARSARTAAAAAAAPGSPGGMSTASSSRGGAGVAASSVPPSPHALAYGQGDLTYDADALLAEIELSKRSEGERAVAMAAGGGGGGDVGSAAAVGCAPRRPRPRARASRHATTRAPRPQQQQRRRRRSPRLTSGPTR